MEGAAMPACLPATSFRTCHALVQLIAPYSMEASKPVYSQHTVQRWHRSSGIAHRATVWAIKLYLAQLHTDIVSARWCLGYWEGVGQGVAPHSTFHSVPCLYHSAIMNQVGWLLELYLLETSKVISGQVPTRDSAHSWWLFCAAPRGDQGTSTMTH